MEPHERNHPLGNKLKTDFVNYDITGIQLDEESGAEKWVITIRREDGSTYTKDIHLS